MDTSEFSLFSSKLSTVMQCKTRPRAQRAVLSGAAGHLPSMVSEGSLLYCAWCLSFYFRLSLFYLFVGGKLSFILCCIHSSDLLCHAQTQQASTRSSATSPVNWGRGQSVRDEFMEQHLAQEMQLPYRGIGWICTDCPKAFLTSDICPPGSMKLPVISKPYCISTSFNQSYI